MCISPFVIKRNRISPYLSDVHTSYIPVGCGHCPECVTKKQTDTKHRAMKERNNWKYSCLVTYSYDNEHLPFEYFQAFDKWYNGDVINYKPKRFYNFLGLSKKYDSYGFKWLYYSIKNFPDNKERAKYKDDPNPIYDYLFNYRLTPYTRVPSLRRKHLTDFIKRAQIKLHRLCPEYEGCSYIYCGEYGPQTLRPHYHCLFMFNIEPTRFQSVFGSRDVWSFGNVDFKLCDGNTEAISGYVAKYCDKPAALDNPYMLAGVVEPTFQRKSIGFGKGYISELQKICSKPPVPVEGDYFGYNKDYLSWLSNQLNIYTPLPDGSVSCDSLPRYWRDEVFPKKIVKRYVRTENQRPIFREVAVKDPDAPLSFAFAMYSEERYQQLFDEKLEQIGQEHPDCSPTEILAIYQCMEMEDLRQRYRRKLEKAQSYYESKCRKSTY